MYNNLGNNMTQYKFKTKPFKHQLEAFNLGKDKKEYAYLMEMGTGKTKVAIDNVCHLYQNNKIKTVIVIAPNSVYRNWMFEINTHSPEQYHVNVHKKDKKFTRQNNLLNYYLFNVEAFSHDKGSQILKSVVEEYGSQSCVILDESTTIKNRQAKRTKNILQVCRPVSYKRILTGSPITKSPLDLYSQTEFLKQGALGFTNYFVFRARYSVMKQIQVNGNQNIMIPIYYQNLDELEEKLKKFSFRVKKDDCLDLPPKVYEKRMVSLSKQQQEIYNDLKLYCRTVIENEMVSYTNKLSEINKLQQVACGFLNTDDGEVKELPNTKLKELFNILDEVEGKVIIWSTFVKSIELICEELKNKYGAQSTVEIYGSVSVEARESAVINFQQNPLVKFLVGNPTVGGYGLTLTAASTVIYFNNSFNLEVRQQSEDRAHRSGQKKSVTYIDLIAEKTLDEFILKTLNQKMKLSAQTLGEEVLKYL
jgi:SNF2 family DNA or RNA helicase